MLLAAKMCNRIHSMKNTYEIKNVAMRTKNEIAKKTHAIMIIFTPFVRIIVLTDYRVMCTVERLRLLVFL